MVRVSGLPRCEETRSRGMCHTLLIRVALAAPRMADDRGRACFCGRYSHQLGKHYVDFPDGTQITYNLAECWGKGIMYGERICDYLGTMEYKDPKNNLLYVRVALGSIDHDDEVVCADTPARAQCAAQVQPRGEQLVWLQQEEALVGLPPRWHLRGRLRRREEEDLPH